MAEGVPWRGHKREWRVASGAGEVGGHPEGCRGHGGFCPAEKAGGSPRGEGGWACRGTGPHGTPGAGRCHGPWLYSLRFFWTRGKSFSKGQEKCRACNAESEDPGRRGRRSLGVLCPEGGASEPKGVGVRAGNDPHVGQEAGPRPWEPTLGLPMRPVPVRKAQAPHSGGPLGPMLPQKVPLGPMEI